MEWSTVHSTVSEKLPSSINNTNGGESTQQSDAYASHFENQIGFPIEDPMYRHPLWIIIIFIIAYFFVLCIGVVGNSIVVVVIARSPRMRTVTNLFILNLAMADLMVLVFCIIPTLISTIFVPWILGRFLCKTVPFIQGVSVWASVYSLVAISLDRCIAVHWPLRCQVTKKRARCIILGIWISACIVLLPWALYFKSHAADPEHPNMEHCTEVWPEGLDENLYFIVANFILGYVLPLIIISMCYVLIWVRVWRRRIPSDSPNVSRIELVHQKAKVGVLRMLLVVVLVFAFSWLPLYVIFIQVKFREDMSSTEQSVLSILMPIGQWLGASNSCINPVLYAFLNAKFRRSFFNLVGFHKWDRTPTPHYQKPNIPTVLLSSNNKANRIQTSVYNVTEV